MEGTSNAGFLRQLPSLKFQSPSPALCHRFLNGDGLVTQKEKGKKKKTPTLEATHVGPFTPHFSFPKYPSPLLPRTFPSVCIFLSLHPPFSPALRLIDSTTKCLWQMTRISERNGETLELELEHLSGRIEPPHHLSFCVSMCLLGRAFLSRYLTYVLLLTQQQIDPQLDPEIFRFSTLAYSLCQNVRAT